MNEWGENHLIVLRLKLVRLLQLLGVFVLVVFTLVALDGRIDALLLHVRP